MKYYLNLNSARLFLNLTKYSMTSSLKFFISLIIVFSIESIANADNLSFVIVLRKNVLILFKVEKHLSASAVVIGVVIKIFSSFVVFENDDPKLLSFIIVNISMIFPDLNKSFLVYSTKSSAFNFYSSIIG